ncbi:alpha/beta hydrolase [Subtercola sp. Z020]|uniref:alpha/beta fold hydrolase n=1 Tax=Subtercola sp. Z020 TaxID=2080582 RepID=UPI000CE83E54|nr:alpha/beta hydrolase [Subtercola sp. Z020]PPF77331.1 alpha/beta hydrolase [Subtercola sp. Z020]
MSENRSVEREGREVAFSVEGEGPTLVLIAEAGAGIGYLAGLAHSVASADFRIVRVQAEQAQDVVAVLDEIGAADAWIGGHGDGGTIARTVALQNHDRVGGVLLFGVEQGDGVPEVAEGIPVLVIQGSVDEVTPPENGLALQAAAPGLVSVVTLEGAGHDFPSSHVGEAAWAVEDYLDWD